MKLARILMAASSGTNGHRVAGLELERIAVDATDLETDVAHHLAQDRDVADPGTLRRMHELLGQDGGGHLLSTAFLAPAMRTSPDSGMPPVITNFCMER